MDNLVYVCDNHKPQRHLICIPYSITNLHKMAKDLKLPNWNYHSSVRELSHYDIPVRREEDIVPQCKLVSTREIVRIIRQNKLSYAPLEFPKRTEYSAW